MVEAYSRVITGFCVVLKQQDDIEDQPAELPQEDV
jgi:hypothetical protein